jgi:hypothetical protein
MDDQRSFAALSGDFNPLHLDPQVARRTVIGRVAVHGVHTLLWALDRLCADDPSVTALRSLRAKFDAPIALGRTVGLRIERPARGGVKLVVVGDDGADALVAVVETAPRPAGAWRGRTEPPVPVCENPSIDDLPGLSGSLALVLPSGLEALFPHLARAFDGPQIAALLASTRLVGMVCPGLHSIFSELRLRFEDAPPAEVMDHRVTHWDPRFGLVEIGVAGSAFEGRIRAFRRPEPVRQPSFAELRSSVPPAVAADAFAGQKALVIGGSRGLGELTAELLASGGADVAVTYHTGEADARRLVGEAAEAGLSMTAHPFDVLSPSFADFADAPPTHLYVFASPRIPVGIVGRFDVAAFERLCAHYSVGLARLAQAFATAFPNRPCTVWFPSTMFLDDGEKKFAEYRAAKACAEETAAVLATTFAKMRFLSARLPRLPSDQTRSLVDVEVADPVETLVRELLAVAAAGRP